MTVLVIAEGVAILLLGLLVAGLLRSHAEILRKLHDLGASVEGGAEPDFNFAPTVQSPGDVSGVGHDLTGTTPTEDAIAIRVSGVRHRTLLAFLSSGCLTCAEFWDAFGGDAPAELGDTRLVVVTKDASEESPSRIRTLAPSDHHQHGCREMTVRTVCLQTLMQEQGLDSIGLLKLDCEGAEHRIFATMDAKLSESIGEIWMEYHERPEPNGDLAGMHARLEALGYRRIWLRKGRGRGYAHYVHQS